MTHPIDKTEERHMKLAKRIARFERHVEDVETAEGDHDRAVGVMAEAFNALGLGITAEGFAALMNARPPAVEHEAPDLAAAVDSALSRLLVWKATTDRPYPDRREEIAKELDELLANLAEQLRTPRDAGDSMPQTTTIPSLVSRLPLESEPAVDEPTGMDDDFDFEEDRPGPVYVFPSAHHFTSNLPPFARRVRIEMGWDEAMMMNWLATDSYVKSPDTGVSVYVPLREVANALRDALGLPQIDRGLSNRQYAEWAAAETARLESQDDD